MKKRIVPILLAVVLLTAALIPLATASGTVKYVSTRNGKPLNVRSWPSVSSSLLGTIPNGQAVTVENYTTDYTWAVITFNGQKAYVMTQYLMDGGTPEPVYPTPTVTPAPSASSPSFAGSVRGRARTAGESPVSARKAETRRGRYLKTHSSPRFPARERPSQAFLAPGRPRCAALSIIRPQL